jgi:hypothetical protein
MSAPAARAGGLASPGAVAGVAVGFAFACVAAAVLLLRLCRRPRKTACELASESPPEPASAEPGSAYTLSMEEGREFVSDYDDLARIDARPPVLEESDGALFPGDEPPMEDAAAWLPGRHEFARRGQQAVMMRSLLGQY